MKMNALDANKSARRLPGIPEKVQEFLVCILFHMLLPYVPLVAELAVLGRVDRKTQLLFMAIYPVSIGVSSQSRLMFGATIVVGLTYSIFFGLATAGAVLTALTFYVGYAALILTMFVHACERYNRHVVGDDLFWKFSMLRVVQ